MATAAPPRTTTNATAATKTIPLTPPSEPLYPNPSAIKTAGGDVDKARANTSGRRGWGGATDTFYNQGFLIKGLKLGNTQLPDIKLHGERNTNLKFRKYFYPVKLTELRVGCDIDVVHKEWKFKWDWRDRIIGGKLTVLGTEIQLGKRFTMDRTCVDIQAAYDFRLKKSRVGLQFRPFEGFTVMNFPQGISFRKKFGIHRNFQVGFHGAMEFPADGYSMTNNGGISFGEGNIDLNILQTDLYFNLY